MPNTPNRTAVQTAWLLFVADVKTLMSVQRNDRPLDQYLVFRDQVLALVQNDLFLQGLQQGWPPSVTESPAEGIPDSLLEEVRAFLRAMEVARVTEKEGFGRRFRRRWLGRAGTVTDSVADLLTILPEPVKVGLKLFREAIDLFKG